MPSIPTVQITNAYYEVSHYPNQWYKFGKGAYELYYDSRSATYILSHYGTVIYRCNMRTRKFEVDGWSKSDVDSINSLAYHTGIGGAYIKNGVLYATGTGPKYKKR